MPSRNAFRRWTRRSPSNSTRSCTHEAFQKLESSWRGLNYLVMQSETGTGLKIHVFNATKKELVKDFQSAPEFDQSALFKKIYDEEYGMFGGAPYSALDRRLRVRPAPAGHVPAGGDLARGGCGARAFHLGRVSRAVRMGQLHRAVGSARPRQAVRDRGVHEVAVVPELRRLPLRRPGAAARAGAPALRQGQRPGRSVQLRRGRERQGAQQVPVDECGLRLGHPDHRCCSEARVVRRHPRRGRWRPG